MKRKKKYNPQKEVGKITSSVVGVSLGTKIGYDVAGVAGHGAADKITPAMKTMGIIPTAQAGSSIVGAVSMLGKQPGKKKKRKRR